LKPPTKSANNAKNKKKCGLKPTFLSKSTHGSLSRTKLDKEKDKEDSEHKEGEEDDDKDGDNEEKEEEKREYEEKDVTNSEENTTVQRGIAEEGKYSFPPWMKTNPSPHLAHN
jgi:hypothetical protein